MLNIINVNTEDPKSYSNYDTESIVNSDMTRERWLEDIVWRFPILKEFFDSLVEGEKVMEIWSWSGKLGKDLIDKYKIKYRWVDLVSPKYLDKKNHILRDLKRNLDGFPQETVDLILSFFSTQYLPNALIVSRDAYAMLKPNGIWFINTGVYWSMSEKIKRKMIENNPDWSVMRLTNNEIIEPQYWTTIAKIVKNFSRNRKLIWWNILYDDILILNKKEDTKLRIPERYIAVNGEEIIQNHYNWSKTIVENWEKFFYYYEENEDPIQSLRLN